DRIFEVVAIPRHERAKHVAAESQFAEFGRGTVGNDIALFDDVAHLHQRSLIDAGVLVGALELQQVVDVDAGGGDIGLVRCADDDTRGVDLVDNAATTGTDGNA